MSARSSDKDVKDELDLEKSTSPESVLPPARRGDNRKKSLSVGTTSDVNSGVEGNRDEHYAHNPAEDFWPTDDHLREVETRSRERDFARVPSRSQQAGLSRHISAAGNIVRLRSTVPQEDSFNHPLAHVKTDLDALVDFDGKQDPYSPLNWSPGKKWLHVSLYALTTCVLTFATSCFASGLEQVQEDFNVGHEVAVLGIALMMFGMGLGPLLWAPLSELYGRKLAVLTPFFISAIFSFGSATAKDIQTLMITRFFAGFFGSSAVTTTGGVLADLFPARNRAYATVVYTMATTGGPTLGPIVGGAIVASYLRWRWTEYLSAIMMMATLIADVIFLDETYAPVLLVFKARRLRIKTGNWALHAKHEEWDVSLSEMAHKYLIRPLRLMVEPICCLMSIYCAFVYGLLYGNLAAFPIIYQTDRGWGQVTGSLPFIAILVGIFAGAILNIWNQHYYIRMMDRNNGRPVPEGRLPSVMIGGVSFMLGLFIFAWTTYPDVFWFAGCIGSFFVGLGYFAVFQGGLAYLVDTFTKYGASATAVSTFMRSMFAAVFPIVVPPMYANLGTQWATSVFAFIALALVPIPFLFFHFGKRIRAAGEWSKLSC